METARTCLVRRRLIFVSGITLHDEQLRGSETPI
jgi:hypothetical protein